MSNNNKRLNPEVSQPLLKSRGERGRSSLPYFCWKVTDASKQVDPGWWESDLKCLSLAAIGHESHIAWAGCQCDLLQDNTENYVFELIVKNYWTMNPTNFALFWHLGKFIVLYEKHTQQKHANVMKKVVSRLVYILLTLELLNGDNNSLETFPQG